MPKVPNWALAPAILAASAVGMYVVVHATIVYLVLMSVRGLS